MRQQQMTKLPFNGHKMPETFTIAALTWNLFGSIPPHNSLVQLSRSPMLDPTPDLILFATQECERSLCMSFCCEAKDQWEDALIEVFVGHRLLVNHVMNGMHLAVLVREAVSEHLQVEEKTKMRAGFGGCMGNKGAISLQMTFMGQPMQVINCHLAAHQGQSNERNATVGRIMTELVSKQSNREVLILGDFNYRIDMTKGQYSQMVSSKNKQNSNRQMRYLEKWRNSDQLIKQQYLHEDFLKQFSEGEITFPPTYKIGVTHSLYNDERIPGWTDRIFSRNSTKMVLQSYGCEYDIMGSDHRPVIGRYERRVEEWVQSEAMVGVNGGSSCQLI